MGTSALLVALAAAQSLGASIPEQLMEKQNTAFERWWGTELVWKFDELPDKGSVPAHRVPYSGHIYPDTAGGTVAALNKYDQAIHGRYLASSYERWDTSAFKEPVGRVRFGLFGRRFAGRSRMRTPHWHGHCNGWTAAAIRHAEPQNSVRWGGVVFRPADIKGLLAEIYIYNDTEMLAGLDYNLDAGTFHTIIANWLGRGSHAVGMEADPGREKWNYPIYAYASSSAKHSDREVEVKMNIAYAKDSSGEYQESPRIKRIKYFHYMLNLDGDGDIVGGYFYRDSNIIDMLWIPLRPKQGGREGNERGNPHVDVDQVLAIWRASVPEDVRQKWVIVDPPNEDRVLEVAETDSLFPLQEFPLPEETEAVARADSADDESALESSEAESPSHDAPSSADSAAADAGEESDSPSIEAAASEVPDDQQAAHSSLRATSELDADYGPRMAAD